MSLASLRYRFAHVIRKLPFLLVIPYHVYRFFQPKFSTGVVGIVWDGERVLLVEHVFHPRLPWGLPGGWVGFNESPAQATIRELHEELGLVVEKVRLVMLEKTQYHHLDIAYLCDVSNTVQHYSNELLGYRWFRLEELPHMHKFHYDAIVASLTLK